MKIKQYEIWIADLNPRFGTETGKTRPVVIIQTDLLNNFHPSTIICPITTNVKSDAEILRVHLTKGSSKLKEDCDIMIDQIRAIDNKRLLKKIGELNQEKINFIKANLSIILDISITVS
jgi:mRNA interferase MazF